LNEDWPAIINRLEGMQVNVKLELGVTRMTLWRWKHSISVPSGDYAKQLVLLDLSLRREKIPMV